MKNNTLLKIGLILLLILLSSCSSLIQRLSPEKESAHFQLVPEQEWPLLEDDLDQKSLEQAVNQSLAYLKSQPLGEKFLFGPGEIANREILSTLNLFLEILQNHPDGKSRQCQIKSHFHLYRIVQDKKPLPVLITGYYEPILQGSRVPSHRFRYPVYRLPDDLFFIDLGKFSNKFQGQKWIGRIEGNHVIPYYTRQEIDQEARLAGKNTEILWVDDPLKLFFMHIQGSGLVFLEDGSQIKLGYRAANGHPYYAIGRELIRRGVFKPEEISLQSIYSFLRDHPEEQETLLNLNPSYIFFQEVQGGPFGSLGLPLTPGRSIAMDLKIFPPAGLIWLRGVKPALDNQVQIQSWLPFGRWVCIQDSGGAIKGPTRLDLYWGNGEEAEMAAGHLHHQGSLFVLLKK